jgi:hypothetical protein
MIDGGISGVLFTCEGTERPDAVWASIAEAIEFPATLGPSDLVGIGGRVEVESSGFAMTFPTDWVWARPSDARTDVLVDRLAAVTDPAHAEDRRLAVAWR